MTAHLNLKFSVYIFTDIVCFNIPLCEIKYMLKLI